ncbi:MAG: hypothetical protein AAEJ04_09640, partial [Planctomycetota bacterium]
MLFICLQILLTTGCGLIYQHRLETPAGTIWTNDDISNARKYQTDLAWMQHGLKELLPKTSRNIGSATILIDTQQRHENRIVHEQEVHTAGWYNRILSLVRFT